MLFGALIGPSLNQFLRSLPGHQTRLSAYIATLANWLVERGIDVSVEDVRGVFNPGWIMNLAGDILSTLSGLLTNEPKLMGKGMSLSTLVVFLSLVFRGWVLGPMGMILSVPINSMVKIALESSENTKGFAVILGSGTEVE